MFQTRRRQVAGAGVVLACVLALAGCADLLGSATDAGDADDPAFSEPATTDPAESEPSATPTPDDLVDDDGSADSDGDGDGASADRTDPAETAPADDRAPVDVIAAATMGTDAVVSAGGYVQDVIEVGGACAFTLTQGTEVVTGESMAEPDATTTWCANVELRLPHPGEDWELELRYESPMSVGVGNVTSDGDVS